MLTRRTIIGIIAGAIIIAIGAAALATSIGPQGVSFDDEYSSGEATAYEFTAPAGMPQSFAVEADIFEVAIDSSEGGYDLGASNYKESESFEWASESDATVRITVDNLGASEMRVYGTFVTITEPIFIAYHLLVITAGVVIIGFSAGFSIRRPKGF